MTLQYSVAVRNARLDAVESTIGTSAILEIRSGAQPANCAAADSGTLLASMSLPSSTAWRAMRSSASSTASGSRRRWANASGTSTASRS